MIWIRLEEGKYQYLRFLCCLNVLCCPSISFPEPAILGKEGGVGGEGGGGGRRYFSKTKVPEIFLKTFIFAYNL